MGIYHAGKSSVTDFAQEQDLVSTVYEVETGRPVLGMSKGGGEILWYVHELPVIGISVNSRRLCLQH